MEYVNCNFCNSNNYNLITSQRDIVHKSSNKIFNIVECSICKLNYTNPRPNINEIKKYYVKNYNFYSQYRWIDKFKRNILYFFANIFLGDIFIFFPYIHDKLKLFVRKKIKNPITINKNIFFLDIECGSGNSAHFWGYNGSIKFFLKKTKNIYAVEPSPSSQKSLNKMNVNVFNDIYEINGKINFDIIRMNWSLEHTHDPKKYFNFISNRLNKNGYSLICIPNYDGNIYQIDKSNVELPVHLYHFKFKDILNFCNLYNLKIETFKTFSYASMYYFSSTINKNFEKYKHISLRQLRILQKKLNIYDSDNKGNDMYFIITKNK